MVDCEESYQKRYSKGREIEIVQRSSMVIYGLPDVDYIGEISGEYCESKCKRFVYDEKCVCVVPIKEDFEDDDMKWLKTSVIGEVNIVVKNDGVKEGEVHLDSAEWMCIVSYTMKDYLMIDDVKNLHEYLSDCDKLGKKKMKIKLKGVKMSEIIKGEIDVKFTKGEEAEKWNIIAVLQYYVVDVSILVMLLYTIYQIYCVEKSRTNRNFESVMDLHLLCFLLVFVLWIYLWIMDVGWLFIVIITILMINSMSVNRVEDMKSIVWMTIFVEIYSLFVLSLRYEVLMISTLLFKCCLIMWLIFYVHGSNRGETSYIGVNMIVFILLSLAKTNYGLISVGGITGALNAMCYLIVGIVDKMLIFNKSHFFIKIVWDAARLNVRELLIGGFIDDNDYGWLLYVYVIIVYVLVFKLTYTWMTRALDVYSGRYVRADWFTKQVIQIGNLIPGVLCVMFDSNYRKRIKFGYVCMWIIVIMFIGVYCVEWILLCLLCLLYVYMTGNLLRSSKTEFKAWELLEKDGPIPVDKINGVIGKTFEGRSRNCKGSFYHVSEGNLIGVSHVSGFEKGAVVYVNESKTDVLAKTDCEVVRGEGMIEDSMMNVIVRKKFVTGAGSSNADLKMLNERSMLFVYDPVNGLLGVSRGCEFVPGSNFGAIRTKFKFEKGCSGAGVHVFYNGEVYYVGAVSQGDSYRNGWSYVLLSPEIVNQARVLEKMKSYELGDELKEVFEDERVMEFLEDRRIIGCEDDMFKMKKTSEGMRYVERQGRKVWYNDVKNELKRWKREKEMINDKSRMLKKRYFEKEIVNQLNEMINGLRYLEGKIVENVDWNELKKYPSLLNEIVIPLGKLPEWRRVKFKKRMSLETVLMKLKTKGLNVIVESLKRGVALHKI
jgi:hypothetical protein